MPSIVTLPETASRTFLGNPPLEPTLQNPPQQPASRIILLLPPTSRTDLPPGTSLPPEQNSPCSYPRPFIISLVMATLERTQISCGAHLTEEQGQEHQSICSSHSKSSSSDKFPALSIVTISPPSLPCLGAEPWAPPQMAKPDPGFPQS